MSDLPKGVFDRKENHFQNSNQHTSHFNNKKFDGDAKYGPYVNNLSNPYSNSILDRKKPEPRMNMDKPKQFPRFDQSPDPQSEDNSNDVSDQKLKRKPTYVNPNYIKIEQKIYDNQSQQRSYSPSKVPIWSTYHPSQYQDERKSKENNKDVFENPKDFNKKNPIQEVKSIIKSRVHHDILILDSFLYKYQNDDQVVKACQNILAYSTQEKNGEESLKVLPRGRQSEAVYTSLQCASILANMFLCKDMRTKSKFLNKDSNFHRVFYKEGREEAKFEKLKLFFEYFAYAPSLRNTIIIRRFCQHPKSYIKIKDLFNSFLSLARVSLHRSGSIEQALGSAWVDFANKYIGGGVLGSGFVQEEKLFACNPELIVSMLICEGLDDNECVTMSMVGSYESKEIVAIDALDVSKNPSKQYEVELIEREINKALIGYQSCENSSIATGNWGCGIFGGDPQLKFLIQVIAASLVGKRLEYYTFNEKKLAEVEIVMSYYRDKKIGVLVQDISKVLKNVKKYSIFEGLLYIMNNKPKF